VPRSCKNVVRLCVGLRVAFAAPVEALFAVEWLFLLPAPHFFPLPFWDRALAAAVFEAALVRPSLRTLLAADAALELVCLEFLDAMVYYFPKQRCKTHRDRHADSFESVYKIPVGYFYISPDIQRPSVAQLDAPSRPVQLGFLLTL